MLEDYKKLAVFDGHQAVYDFADPKSGLKGYIAIHRGGPSGISVGGTRMFPYATAHDALHDVLRLSKAMTYKCAIAGLPFGGGKAVIIADPRRQKTPELLEAYAQELNKLKGKFYTGEDVGLTEYDVQELLRHSKYLIGKSSQAGDPSRFAALSVFECIKAAFQFVYGSDSVAGKTVAIKGLGKTGAELAALLLGEGARVVGADINNERALQVKEILPGLQLVDLRAIFETPADVFSPCALGDDLNPETIATMRPKIICGTANNQLDNEKSGELLARRGFLYVPDYLANAGGLIDVACELEPNGYSRKLVLERIARLKQTCFQVLTEAHASGKPTNYVAARIAEQFLMAPQKETA